MLLGLGSIVGTGVFVSIGLAAGAGAMLLPAIVLAAIVALFNGLSSAQLAAAHPVSGGTYEYGYRWLHPAAGFAAGWLFLCAKSASAATAAMGLSGYVLRGLDAGAAMHAALAIGATAGITVLVAGGLRRSNAANAILVALVIASLGALTFAALGAPATASTAGDGETGFLRATALMFVAYTGYGRIATLGEEVRDPARSIPRAVIACLVVVLLLYFGVAAAALHVVDGATLSRAARTDGAPLVVVARAVGSPGLARAITVAAVLAMAGVLVNLVLGLSRVLLAMARRGDAPARLAEIRGGSPRVAVYAVGTGIAVIALPGDIGLAWSFSAFTVLLYYALTNLAALRLAPQERRFPRWTAVAGLAGCLSLAFFVETTAWVAGIVVLLAGFALRLLLHARPA